jgi:sensor domain CHASE-containing protein
MSMTILFSYEVKNIEQEKQLYAVEKFGQFNLKFKDFVFSNVILLKGFSAYVQTFEDLNDEETYKFLDFLLGNNLELIKNVGILKDTTIVWNYPYEENKTSIGVDLSKVEGQKDIVNKVKLENKTMLQGPVALVQGGMGYIIRAPILDENEEYWGQASIVLRADEFKNEIKKIEDEIGINVIIEDSGNIVYSQNLNTNGKIYSFCMDDDSFNWNIGIIIKDLPQMNFFRIVFIIVAIIILLVSLGISTYFYIVSNEKIRIESTLDSLTGLRNRKNLDEYIRQE